jgi:uncharacterized membrane protein YeaQ/YmgE (transglycosylase-associated protein family)
VLKRGEGTSVNLPTDNLIVIIGVGVTVGWFSIAVHGTGFGLISDMAIGIVGALIGDLLVLRFNVGLDMGIVALLINAAIGAIILVLIIKFASGGKGWRGGLRETRGPHSDRFRQDGSGGRKCRSRDQSRLSQNSRGGNRAESEQFRYPRGP